MVIVSPYGGMTLKMVIESISTDAISNEFHHISHGAMSKRVLFNCFKALRTNAVDEPAQLPNRGVVASNEKTLPKVDERSRIKL